MKYKGLTIEWENEQCIRDFEDEVKCYDGLWFSVYDGEGRPLEGFDGVFEYSFLRNEQSIQNYVKDFIDKYEQDYISYLQRKSWDPDAIAARLNKLQEKESLEHSYHMLAPLDKDGKIIYMISKHICGKDPENEINTRDNLGFLKRLNGRDLLKYAEADKFGEYMYDGDNVVAVKVDYTSDEFKKYKSDLLKTTIEELLIKKMSLEEITAVQNNFVKYKSGDFSYTPLYPDAETTYMVGSDIKKANSKDELSETRTRQILSGALDYLSDLLKGRELYNVLTGTVGMTNEEIEAEGFTGR